MKLDDRDRRLLELVQQDSRTPVAELAAHVGMSASSCWRRLRAFEDAGLIERYGAVVAPAKVGLNFQAIVHVQLVRHNREQVDEFLRMVSDRPEIVECYATTGQADYHLRVLCPDIAAYNEFLEKVLFTLPAVASAQTNVVLKEVKPRSIVPLSLPGQLGEDQPDADQGRRRKARLAEA